MMRSLLLLLIGLALLAGGAGADLACIDEGYDPLSGGSKRAVARPELGGVLTLDPERAEPLGGDHPSRPPLAASP
jgi:hypothetical protein